MRKGNLLIIAILIVASISFLAMWHLLGFSLVDNPTDLAITIIWWGVIITTCIVIKLTEDARKRALRTCFLAKGIVYNPEAGNVKTGDKDAADIIQSILDGLTYTLKAADEMPEHVSDYIAVVRSDVYANSGTRWTGEVIRIDKECENVLGDERAFTNKEELAAMLNEILDEKLEAQARIEC